MSRLSISSSFLVYCHLRCSLDGILLNLVKKSFSEIPLHDSRIGVNETSQNDKLVSELGVGLPTTEERIAKVRILNEKHNIHHINVAP